MLPVTRPGRNHSFDPDPEAQKHEVCAATQLKLCPVVKMDVNVCAVLLKLSRRLMSLVTWLDPGCGKAF